MIICNLVNAHASFTGNLKRSLIRGYCSKYFWVSVVCLTFLREKQKVSRLVKNGGLSGNGLATRRLSLSVWGSNTARRREACGSIGLLADDSSIEIITCSNIKFFIKS